MMFSAAFVCALSLASDPIPGRNYVRSHEKGLIAKINNNSDASAWFAALPGTDEVRMDTGFERTLTVKTSEDKFQLRCVANGSHVCDLTYATRGHIDRRSDGKGGEFRLSSATSETLYRTLKLPTRSAGHTALKGLQTSDGLLALGCAFHAGEQGPRCWLIIMQ